MGFVALAVDVGVLYSDRTASQRVVDAAALAGAFTFLANPTAPQPSTAVAHALATATRNDIGNTSVAAEDLDVTVDIENRRVTVDILVARGTFFARVLGVNTADVGARATAEAARNASVGACPKPWFVPNTIVSADETCEACADGETLIDPDTGEVTPFAEATLGQQIIVKPQDPGQALGPGQFFAIDLSTPGSGADEYREAIWSCAPPIGCEEIQDIKTGNMVGPTRQGVEELIGAPPRDVYQDIGEYLVDGATLSDVSDALVVAPIWDTCNFPGFCPGGQFPNGTKVNVAVKGFALLFLEGFESGSQGGLIARLINVGGCVPTPVDEPDTTVSGSEVFSFPLRLVRVPPEA
jgi:hypothetical protein